MDGVGTGGDATFGSRLIQSANSYIRSKMVKPPSRIFQAASLNQMGESYQGHHDSTILAEESTYSQLMEVYYIVGFKSSFGCQLREECQSGSISFQVFI